MITIDDTLYRLTARRLVDRIGTADFFNGSVECGAGSGNGIFTSTLILYRDAGRIVDVVPVWWEYHFFLPHGETLTDFCWNELKCYLSEFFQTL